MERQEHRHHLSTFNLDDPNFERKLDLITADAKPYLKKHLLTRITRENCLTIIAYILGMQTEIHLSERYRIDTIFNLKKLAEFHKPKEERCSSLCIYSSDLSAIAIIIATDRGRKATTRTSQANSSREKKTI